MITWFGFCLFACLFVSLLLFKFQWGLRMGIRSIRFCPSLPSGFLSFLMIFKPGVESYWGRWCGAVTAWDNSISYQSRLFHLQFIPLVIQVPVIVFWEAAGEDSNSSTLQSHMGHLASGSIGPIPGCGHQPFGEWIRRQKISLYAFQVMKKFFF